MTTIVNLAYEILYIFSLCCKRENFIQEKVYQFH